MTTPIGPDAIATLLRDGAVDVPGLGRVVLRRQPEPNPPLSAEDQALLDRIGQEFTRAILGDGLDPGEPDG